MSAASGQPYSDASLAYAKAVLRGRLLRGWEEVEMAAALMHDRGTLGLDASARIEDVVDEAVAVIGVMRTRALDWGDEYTAHCYQTVADTLVSEFGATP